MTINEDRRRDWNRIDIVAALHKRGISIRALSVNAGLKPDTLKNALSRAYPKAERIIADALDLAPEQIWPSRYPNRPPAAAAEINCPDYPECPAREVPMS